MSIVRYDHAALVMDHVMNLAHAFAMQVGRAKIARLRNNAWTLRVEGTVNVLMVSAVVLSLGVVQHVCMVVVFVIHNVRLMDFVTLAQKLVNVRQVGLV